MKRSPKRTTAVLTYEALKDMAVDSARQYLAANLQDLKGGLERTRKKSNDATVRLYETILSSPNGRNGVDEWITTMVRGTQAGDTAFDEGLRAISVSLILNGEPLPESLRKWCAETLTAQTRPGGKSGPKPQAKLSRNACIRRAVSFVADEYGFEPTRNVATRETNVESACSIVTQALDQICVAMSEDSVNKIYAKQSRRKN